MATKSRIVKVLKVHDTRQYEEIGDKWVAISGTGEFNTCSRCGRMHEVHVYVLLNDGSSAIVGSGCCKQESLDVQSRITSLVSASQAVKKFQSRLAKEEQQLAEFLKAEQEVISLSLPVIETGTCMVTIGYRKGETIETRIMGDASISLWDGQYNSRDRDLLIHHWREKRLEERGFKYYHGMSLKESVEHTKKQLKKATQRYWQSAG
jgi:hypothetical protein